MEYTFSVSIFFPVELEDKIAQKQHKCYFMELTAYKHPHSFGFEQQFRFVFINLHLL